jgi:hypothetical protein
LIEGINYQMICHHPHGAIRTLAPEVAAFEGDDPEERQPPREVLLPMESPRNVFVPPGDNLMTTGDKALMIARNALMIAQNALLFSDVPFLYPPGQIAFASIAMALNMNDPTREQYDELIHPSLRSYLRTRFSSRAEQELELFEENVMDIIETLLESPVMDVKMLSMSKNVDRREEVVIQQAEELRRVFCKVSSLQSKLTPKISSSPQQNHRKRKSLPDFFPVVSPPPSSSYIDGARKIPKVTPTRPSTLPRFTPCVTK